MNARRGAFDPNQLDDEDILGPPPLPVRSPLAATAPSSVVTPLTDVADRPAATPRRRTRTAAARPAGARLADELREGSTTARAALAVRIPRALYNEVLEQLLSGAERPSYGQIVAWTVEDHADEVTALLIEQADDGGRTPRGRRLPADTVPITLRVLPHELEAIDTVVEAVAAQAGDHKPPTRTALAIAALTVAARQA